MDRRRNWIFVDSPALSSYDRQALYATPSIGAPSTSRASVLSNRPRKDPEARIHSINLLNDRIQRRIASQYPIYANSSTINNEEVERPRDARDGEQRLIDESFRFIADEELKDKKSAEARLDRLIQHRNSQGEIDAVYEKRSVNNSPVRRKQRVWSQYPSPSRQMEYKERERQRRSDSLDSGSVRLNREPVPQRWNLDFGSADNLSERRGIPTLLRRNSHFYNSCDVCAFKTFRPGEFCSYCSKGPMYPPPMFAPPRRMRRPEYRGQPSVKRRYPPHMTRSIMGDPYYNGVQILSASSLKKTVPYVPYWHPPPPLIHEVPTRAPSRYTTHKVYPTMSFKHRPAPWEFENAWRDQTVLGPRRPIKSPVFRYGRALPEELYDYDVYAKERDKRNRQRKAIALAIALLAFALVVSAGVVLAAINY